MQSLSKFSLKQIFTFSIAALVLSSPCNGFASALIDNLKAGKSQKVVVYGTSLTASGAWAFSLGSWLTSTYSGKVTFTNNGMPSQASNVGVSSLQSKVLSLNPDTVFIEFSINDASTLNNISLAQSKANLQTMISQIKANKSSTEIILMTMNPVWNSTNNGGSGVSATYRPHLEEYYQVYRDVALEQGLMLIDNYASWTARYAGQPNDNLFHNDIQDGLHPETAASNAVTFANVKTALLAVPEPSTIALVCAALAMFLLPKANVAHRTVSIRRK